MRRLLVSLVLSLATAPAFAVDISSLLERAETAAAEGRHALAIDALQQALNAVRKDAPMTLDHFMVVARPAKQFGDFEAHATKAFAASEPVLFYVEPKNFVRTQLDPQTTILGLEVDVDILDAEGANVASQKNVQSVRLPSKSDVQDLFFNLSVSLNGAPAGEYRVRWTVRDLNSPKKATAEETITIQ